MGNKFTVEQEAAINSCGNVIVSAGAGSGKTTVLTERVRRNILGQTSNNKVNLDELLILTFTNDAATSMKNKIKEALRKDANLSSLVPFVDSAHIETFDAYSQFIVKKYGHLIGVNKNINVLDSDILYVKIANTISDYLEKQYLKKDPIFEEVIYKFCTKNDNKLLGFLIDVYKEILDKKDYPIIFLKDYQKNILNKNYFLSLLTKANEICLKTIEDFKNTLNFLCSNKLSEFIYSKISTFLNVSSLEELTKLKEELPEPSTLRDAIKKAFEELDYEIDPLLEKRETDRLMKDYKRIYAFSCLYFDYFGEDINNQITYLNYLIDNIFIPTFNDIEKFKSDTGYYTFGDIAKLAIKILEESEEVRNELKFKYKLIMIDETQDTSESQERFINLIANQNVFSVGDIKQSIYRFRNARPELFKRKYDAYSQNIDGKAINMNKNFRSRKEVLNTINDIFSVLMSDDFGGANYKKDHMIIPSNNKYDNEGKSNLEHGIFQIPYSSIYFKDDGEFSDSKESKIKGEASTICDNILKRINDGYLVFDNELNALRPCTFKDFTILTYKGVNFQLFEEVFKEKNVPLNAIYSEDLNSDTSINVLINIFSLISFLSKDNLSEEDESNVRHLFISILRSFIFEYSDKKLYELFKDPSTSYKNDETFKKIENLTKNYAKGPLNSLFDAVINEFKYVNAFSKISEAINTIDKNNIFYNKTKTMDELGYSLDDFVLYLKSLSKFKISMDQVIYTEAKNAVTITTIHKSKGLEYPVVYLPNLFDFKEPTFKNNGDYYVLNGEYFFLPFFSDPHKKTNLVGLLLESDKSILKEDKEERLRLFYVALTRAKEDLVFVVSDDKIDDYETVLEKYIKRIKLKYTKAKVNVSEEEIKQIAQSELASYLDEKDGVTFDDFLFKAFISYPLDPFIDKNIDNYKNNIEKLLKDENEKAKLKKALKNIILRYYYKNHHSLEGIENINLVEEAKVEASKAKKIVDEPVKTEILYSGAIRIYNEILVKIKKFIYSESKINLVFTFYAYKDLTLKNVKEETIETLLNFIKKEDLTFLNTLLAEYFVYDYQDTIEFNKIIPIEGKEILSIEREANKVTRLDKASKDVDEESDESTLNYGTHLHALLEIVSFINPNYDFIKDRRERKLVEGVVELVNKFDINDAQIFKEYQFVDEKRNKRGVIDLLLVYKDKAVVIDYKLKDIQDEEYKKQLLIYKEFVEDAFKVKTNCYLLSIIDQNIKELQ